MPDGNASTLRFLVLYCVLAFFIASVHSDDLNQFHETNSSRLSRLDAQPDLIITSALHQHHDQQPIAIEHPGNTQPTTPQKPIILTLPIPSDPASSTWTQRLTFSRAGPSPISTGLPPDGFAMRYSAPSTTSYVCQNDASYTATITPPPSVENLWATELRLAKTSGKSACGTYDASIARCMNRYTTAYVSTYNSTYAISTGTKVVAEYDNNAMAWYGYLQSTTQLTTQDAATRVQGSHWGDEDPQYIATATAESVAGAKRSCADEESCMAYCQSTKDAEVKFLLVLECLFGFLSFLSLLAAAIRYAYHGGDRGHGTPVATNAPSFE